MASRKFVAITAIALVAGAVGAGVTMQVTEREEEEVGERDEAAQKSRDSVCTGRKG